MSEYAFSPKKPTVEMQPNEDTGELFTIKREEETKQPLRFVPLGTVPRPRGEFKDIQSATANDREDDLL